METRELRVYTRRNKTREGKELLPADHNHESNLALESPNSLGKTSPDSAPSNLPYNDLDQPITLRKYKRTCMNHPIYNFISYEKFSPHYRAFVSKLDRVKVPSSIHEALCIPKWKKAI